MRVPFIDKCINEADKAFITNIKYRQKLLNSLGVEYVSGVC